MRVSVFGLGYVGCVTATCLAKMGHKVVGVDLNADKVMMVTDAVPPVVEPGLGELLAEVMREKRLSATTSSEEAVRETDLSLVCVGTPGRANGQLDVASVERVGKEIGRALIGRTEPYTVVLRSTVLPGTTERVLIPSLLARVEGKLLSPRRRAGKPTSRSQSCSLREFVGPACAL